MRYRTSTLFLIVGIAASVILVCKPKPKHYEYQCWDGGPHVVVPNAVVEYWNGGRVSPFALESHHAQACEIEDWFGFVDVGPAKALVICDPPFAAWDRRSTKSTHYFYILRTWGNNKLDDVIDRAREITLEPTGRTWSVPKGGAFMIYGADRPAGDLAGRIEIPNLEGEYRISTGLFEKGRQSAYVLRLDRIEP